MGIRNNGDKGLTIVPLLSRVLREPQIHDCTVGSRRLRRLLLSRAILGFNSSVLARRFELESRCRSLLRQHRSWGDDHRRRQCPDRFRNPDLANAFTVQAAETTEAKATNHGRVLLGGLVSGTPAEFYASFSNTSAESALQASIAAYSLTRSPTPTPAVSVPDFQTPQQSNRS